MKPDDHLTQTKCNMISWEEVKLLDDWHIDIQPIVSSMILDCNISIQSLEKPHLYRLCSRKEIVDDYHNKAVKPMRS